MRFLYPKIEKKRNDYIYDLEILPNIFTACFYNPETFNHIVFEISDRKNELPKLLSFLNNVISKNINLVGFNNLSFDYPILHLILTLGRNTSLIDINDKCVQLIETPFHKSKYNRIEEPLIKQIDLQSLMGFDTVAKLTSLKMLECNMGLDNVKEMPFYPGTFLNDSEKDILIGYNKHDVFATYSLYIRCLSAIDLRMGINPKWVNLAMPSLGERLLEQKLKAAGVSCNKPVQYPLKIDLKDCIFNYIEFERKELKELLEFFNNKTIYETKGVFKKLTVELDNLTYKLGTGGIHASEINKVYKSNKEWVILDFDFASYYPFLSILNKVYADHLGVEFCKPYHEIYKERKTYKKGTVENISLKEALNSAFGKSNFKYSFLYDPKVTMTITINGQLILLMLIERLLKIEDLKIIQSNTDGLTIFTRRIETHKVIKYCKEIELLTKGQLLEATTYKEMFIANVNNYIAVLNNGKVKRVGCYKYGKDLELHKNHSQQIVQIAAERFMVNGEDYIKTITECVDVRLFIINLKVDRTSKIMHGKDQVQNVTRFIADENGEQITIVRPSSGKLGDYKRKNKLTDEYFYKILGEIKEGSHDERIHTKNKSKYEIRVSEFMKNQNVTIMESLKNIYSIDYSYYISECEKIIIKIDKD